MEARVFSILSLLLLVIAGVAVSQIASREGRHKLYLLTLLPYPDPRPSFQPSWDEGPNILPAAELAVEHINARQDILREYKLELINEDGGCNISSKALISFVRQVFFHKKQIVGIIGPGCSRSSIAASSLSGRNDVSLLTVHLGGSPLLSNRTLYPYSFSILGSTLLYVETIIGLVNRNSWRFITVLYDETRLFFSTTFQELEKVFHKRIFGNDSEISFSSPVSFTHIPLRTIQYTGIRITFVLTGPEYARWIMCLAYYENMLYPMHQWIIVGRELSEFKDTKFIYDGRIYNCTHDLFANTILNGVLLVNYRIKANNTTTVSTQTNYSFEDYQRMYEERVADHNANGANISSNMWGTTVYDAVWTLALALNSSGVNLTEYQFNHSNTTDHIRTHIRSLEFNGVSGHINYDNETGFTTRLIDIHQVFDATEQFVAYSNFGNISITGSPQFVPNVYITMVASVHPAIGALFMAITIVELVFVIAAHIISIVYNKYKSIKAASPKLNHLIYIGCYFSITAALMFMVIKVFVLDDETTGTICHITVAWFLPVGYTLVFGTIAARTWRLYRIFIHYLDPGPFISNPVLFTFVSILLLIDLVYAIVWTAIDPIYVKYVTDDTMPTSEDTRESTRRCESHHFIWYLILFMNKALLLATVSTLSLLTRNIKNKQFSTHYLRVGIYTLVLTVVVGVPIYFILQILSVDYHAEFIVFSLEVEAIVLLLLVFILFPPIVPLLKEKHLHAVENYVLRQYRKFSFSISSQ